MSEMREMREMSDEIDKEIYESAKQEVIAELAKIMSKSDPLKQQIIANIIKMLSK